MKYKRIQKIVDAYLNRCELKLNDSGDIKDARLNLSPNMAGDTYVWGTITMPWPKTKWQLMIFLHEIGHSQDTNLTPDVSNLYFILGKHQEFADLWMLLEMDKLGIKITDRMIKDFENITNRKL